MDSHYMKMGIASSRHRVSYTTDIFFHRSSRMGLYKRTIWYKYIKTTRIYWYVLRYSYRYKYTYLHIVMALRDRKKVEREKKGERRKKVWVKSDFYFSLWVIIPLTISTIVYLIFYNGTTYYFSMNISLIHCLYLLPFFCFFR